MTQILHKRSATPAKVPLTSDIDLGELAINTNDGEVYIKKSVASVESIVLLTPVKSVAGKTGVISLVKGDVGLGNVDNTADTAKPVSTAQQTALNLKANLAGPTFTGVPAAPTATTGTNTTQIATTAFVIAQAASSIAAATIDGGTY